MKKFDKRDRILRTTLELIAENGFHGTTTALIAKSAGVAEGTIYKYFKNKEDLVLEVYKDCEERMFAFVAEGYRVDIPIRDRFIYLAKRFVLFHTADTLDYLFILQFQNSPYAAPVRQAKHSIGSEKSDVFIELFKQAVKLKIVKQFPIIVLFDISYRPMLAVVRDIKDGLIKSDEHFMESIIGASWDSIKL